jgi:hypothetical protein
VSAAEERLFLEGEIARAMSTRLRVHLTADDLRQRVVEAAAERLGLPVADLSDYFHVTIDDEGVAHIRYSLPITMLAIVGEVAP